MRLKNFLDEHGIAAHVFAAKIGISASAIYKYRTQTRKKPSPWTIAKIQKATGNKVTLKDWL
jgi:predicted transcriptional regulator